MTHVKLAHVYCELTSLKLANIETVTEYFLSAKTNVVRLKEARENESDFLPVVMVLKRLPKT